MQNFRSSKVAENSWNVQRYKRQNTTKSHSSAEDFGHTDDLQTQQSEESCKMTPRWRPSIIPESHTLTIPQEYVRVKNGKVLPSRHGKNAEIFFCLPMWISSWWKCISTNRIERFMANILRIRQLQKRVKRSHPPESLSVLAESDGIGPKP